MNALIAIFLLTNAFACTNPPKTTTTKAPKTSLTTTTSTPPPTLATVPRLYDRCNTPNVISLTFDDGPSTYTQAISDYLVSQGIKATFFVIGQNIAPLASTVSNVGTYHDIGVHTWTHPYLTTLPLYGSSSVYSELSSTADAIASLTGKHPTYFRPPYSDFNDATLQIAQSLNLNLILYNIDSQDYINESLAYTEPIMQSSTLLFGSPSTDGTLSIMHDRYSTSLDLLKFTVQSYKSRGYTFVDLKTCIGV